mmetsp:Transcript_22207/g.72150  ORF Transcript_22207/g.72150 Transcript_22207/m.72150 type:complete len:381 (+) Transcript_22207:26-1168(+)
MNYACSGAANTKQRRPQKTCSLPLTHDTVAQIGCTRPPRPAPYSRESLSFAHMRGDDGQRGCMGLGLSPFWTATPLSTRRASSATAASRREGSAERVREESRRHLGRDFVEEEDGATLTEEAPGHAAPQRGDARLCDEHARRLAVPLEAHLLDVALHARLDGVGRMRGKRADRAGDEGGSQPRRVLALAKGRVRVRLANVLAHRRQDAHEPGAVDALAQAEREHAARHYRRAAASEVATHAEDGAALALLLDHDQLERSANHARAEPRREAGANLLCGRRLAGAAGQHSLGDAVEVELRHEAEPVVEHVRAVAAVQDSRVHGERQPLLLRILPVVCALEQRRVGGPTDGADRAVLEIGESIGGRHEERRAAMRERNCNAR